MDDQVLFDQFHATYDFEPRAGSFERLRATLVNAGMRPRRDVKSGLQLPRPNKRLVAAVALVALGIASAGAFVAINEYVHRAVPTTAPPARTGTIPGAAVRSATFWPFSADDAAAVLYGVGVTMQERQLDPDTVFFTHDGGATWRPVKMPCCYTDSPGFDVRWIDADNIVVVYGSHLIDVTTDGGIHWQVTRSGHDEGSNLPFFLNAHEGWQYGSSGLFHTTDGGAHWTVVSTFPSSKEFDWWVDRPVFIDSEDGFIHPSGYNEPWITHDGGHTWSRGVFSPPAPASQFGNVPQGPFMFGKSGVIAFLNPDGITLSVYETSDGGLTWSEPRTAPGSTLAALGIDEWWVLDGEGHLSSTSDGGSSWQSIHASLPSRVLGMTLSSITPVGRSVLWGGVSDAIVRSTDGGAHWSIVKLPA